jgi:transposase
MIHDLLQDSQQIYNFQTISCRSDKKSCEWHITRSPEDFKCPKCLSVNVSPARSGHRVFRGVDLGCLEVWIHVRMHRLNCRDCGSYCTESLDFAHLTKARYTKLLAYQVLAYCQEMPLKSVTRFTGLKEDTIRDIEKQYLKTKYETIDLSKVTCIGIDEVHLGNKMGFATIVRDLEDGRVLNVSRDRNGQSLQEFHNQLVTAGAELEVVAIDLGNTYSYWVKQNWPNAVITYDHFHVIKLMNERLNEP